MGRGRSRSQSRDRDRKKSSDKKLAEKKKSDSRERDRSDRAPASGSTSNRDDRINSIKDSESRSGKGRDNRDRDSSSIKDRDYGRSRVRGGSAGRTRSRSRENEKDYRKGDREQSHRDRDQSDRDRDRRHRDTRKDRKDRDRDRERDRGNERDRKRSRGHEGSSRRRGKYDSSDDDDDRRGAGRNPDEAWKRKLADEDEQLLDIDPDDLMLDEEEEERRLEEERRKRKEKLEALQRKAAEAEKAKKMAAAESSISAAEPTAGGRGGREGEGGAQQNQNKDQSAAQNGAAGIGYSNHQQATDGLDDDAAAAAAAAAHDDDDDSADDDAGPIEIIKQGSELNRSSVNGDNDDPENDDMSGAQKDNMTIPGAGKTVKVTGRTAGEGEGDGGESSSELRARQGKEDRPVFDMFSAASLTAAAVGPSATKIGGKGGGDHMAYGGGEGGGDQGNWTDVEGYYKTRVGEVIGGRYTVLGTVGQGVFSTVLKCLDTRAGPGNVGGASEVALKMIRNNDTMRKAAQKEVAILKELAEHDPANKKHCIRMLCSLEHKQHTVMVFESMQMNLRETLTKFGRKTGINIHAVQKYAKQLMAALKHMASRHLVHADIKPDNILVDQGFGSLKLADFGSAFRETDPDNDPTPYLVSRWYRAPEIVMGLEYDKAIDLWSVAVTLFELYKGAPVLQGATNNDMLKRMMELKGPVPQRMIKNHIRAFETMGGIRPHFNERGEFMQQEPDPVSGQTTVRLVTVTAPSKPIKAEIMRSKGAQDKKDTVANLADFLDKCMSLDPRQRMSLEQCAAHSFLRR